ncbi:MAG: hypothetical protein K8W52_28975 [Deltaproteobacteria bacterium]|nr:hypothetical protein [Deltaproteobacteria bacterium]
MAAVFYVHWDEGEAEAHARPLVALGHRVALHAAVGTSPSLPDATDVVAISIDRLPSHGRAIAEWLGRGKQRRAIPIVFVGGSPAAATKIRAQVPGAMWCARAELPDVVARLTAPPLHRPRRR